MLQKVAQDIPSVRPAHWLIRLQLASMILQQDNMKLPLTEADAASWGLPFVLWAMADWARSLRVPR
ncbi:MAG: hypothetical protein AAFR98_02615 [Pseudomonadota bacterium]